ncbi:pentatricopeptide repeat-containing protein At4g01570 [Gastrolobium bilobum]|uniref:pentatricopeptide repeat-containing protein At4g01570 n=1 Tax=Gastrolobium bilobum TaxID=150636 RepID=UPI002AB31F78|nr:pentatricopeptide repeat-containing protein At4g01570 [Gastrolobium bilobum]
MGHGIRMTEKMGELLLVASITKTLSESGTRNLTHFQSLKLTESIILKILSNPSLHPSKKLDFFNWTRSYTHTASASAYSTIFRAVCRSGYLNEVPSLLRSMKQDGVVLDSHSFKLLLDAFIVSENFHSALQILDYMEDLQLLGNTLSPIVYNSLLIALVRKNQLSLAISIFFKLLDADVDADADVDLDVGPCSVACNELLVALRKADMKVEFKQVFQRLREKKGFSFDTWGYNICIHAFGCWGDLVNSLTLFKEMKDKELVGPDLCTYNSLITVLCKVGKVKDALVVWEELNGSGHEPDQFTYTILIQACSKTYRIEDATRMFYQMQNNGFRPDTLVYNSLLDGLFKATKVTEACQLFDKMVQQGVKASCWTFNILIHGLLKNGRPEAAYTLFCDLKKKGQFLDGIAYSIIVLQLCKEGQLEEALQLVEEMESRGFAVDLVTITSLLISIHKHSRWDWTDRLMKHVREGDLVPSVLKWKAGMEASMKNPPSKKKDHTPFFPSKGDFSEITSFITLDSHDAKTKDEDEDEENSCDHIDEWSSSPHMDKLANQVKSTGFSSQLFTPTRGQRVQEKGLDSFDIDMVNTFLSIFLAKGKLSLACKLFEIFSDAGVDPVSYTYNSIMSSFVKKGYFTEALAILTEMGEKLCPADIATYNMIIQGLGNIGRADLASAVLDRLLKQGGYLDIVMYNTLINALGKAGRIDEVNKFFEQMRSSGINPDVVTYNTLIEVHSKAGRLKDAYKFLKMMLDAGCSPNHVTDTTLDYLGREIEKLRYQRASILSEKDDPS